MNPTRTDWRLIGLLYVGGLLAAWQFAKIALSLEPLAEVYPGLPVSLIVSGVSLAGIAFGAMAGVLIARVGARRALLVALFAAAGLTALQALLPAYPVMMTLRVAEGFAHLAIVVAAPTLMAGAAVGRDVPVAMGLWGTFFGVGFALAALSFPFFGGASGILWANAGALFGLALALFPILPCNRPEVSERRSFVAWHLRTYRNPRLVAPASGFFAHTLIFLGLLTFLPEVIGDWTGPILPLVALVGTFGAGLLARTMTPGNIMLLGLGLSAAGFVAALALPEALRLWLVLPVMAVVGLVPGAAFADVPYLNASPSDQALANGAIAQLGNVGTAAAVPLMAFALSAGFAGLVGVVAAISVGGAIGVWLIHRKMAQAA